MNQSLRLTITALGFALTGSSVSAQPAGASLSALSPAWFVVVLSVALGWLGLTRIRQNVTPDAAVQNGVAEMVRLRWPEVFAQRFSHHPFSSNRAQVAKPAPAVVQQLTYEWLRQLDEKQFERLVTGFFFAVGFRAERRPDDENSDTYLFRGGAAQPFGFLRCQCQAGEVGPRTVNDARAVLTAENLAEGYLVAVASFSAEARAGENNRQLMLLDGPQFVTRFNRLPKPVRIELLAQLTPSDGVTPPVDARNSEPARSKPVVLFR
jgi:hypothetical protein